MFGVKRSADEDTLEGESTKRAKTNNASTAASFAAAVAPSTATPSTAITSASVGIRQSLLNLADVEIQSILCFLSLRELPRFERVAKQWRSCTANLAFANMRRANNDLIELRNTDELDRLLHTPVVHSCVRELMLSFTCAFPLPSNFQIGIGQRLTRLESLSITVGAWILLNGVHFPSGLKKLDVIAVVWFDDVDEEEPHTDDADEHVFGEQEIETVSALINNIATDCPALEFLDLFVHDLELAVDEFLPVTMFEPLTKLQAFQHFVWNGYNNCGIDRATLEHFRTRMPQLRRLEIGDPNWTSDARAGSLQIDDFTRLPHSMHQLEYLDTSGSIFNDLFATALRRLPGLTELACCSYRVTDSPAFLGAFASRLASVDFAITRRADALFVDELFQGLVLCTQLKKIWLEHELVESRHWSQLFQACPLITDVKMKRCSKLFDLDFLNPLSTQPPHRVALSELRIEDCLFPPAALESIQFNKESLTFLYLRDPCRHPQRPLQPLFKKALISLLSKRQSSCLLVPLLTASSLTLMS